LETRKIGSLAVSVIGLGCNNFGVRLDEARTAQVVDAALDAGINFFDTADRYGDTRSEEYLGRALDKRRRSAVVATKFGSKIDESRHGAKPEYVRRALEDSLRRLGTDWVDLYQLHRPDPLVPIAETLGALNDLVVAGKVREIGCSNFSSEQLREADEAGFSGGARFVSLQNEYSLLQREQEQTVLTECIERGVAFLPYFPLASGLLTGKYRRGEPPPTGARLADPSARFATRFMNDEKLALADRLAAFAASRGHTLLELALSWLVARPGVTSVIPGATTAEQVRANVDAVRWRLSKTDLGEVDGVTSQSWEAPRPVTSTALPGQ
jgi:aryl-alcohol dehydrogenase-like predicted oxidoreductase